MAISLGAFDFAQFEVPERVRFGGKQALAIHKLPGGNRVVDAMGRDDSKISWKGTFSGADASNRARQLDAMRVAGLATSLTWDAFSYWVIIARLDLDFRNPWWIPFKVTCVVVDDEASVGAIDLLLELSVDVVSDLSAVSSFYDVSSAITASSLTDALRPGTQANATAINSINVASIGLNNSIAASEASFVTAEPSTLTQTAQSLAQLSCARGYLSRAARNATEVNV